MRSLASGPSWSGRGRSVCSARMSSPATPAWSATGRASPRSRCGSSPPTCRWCRWVAGWRDWRRPTSWPSSGALLGLLALLDFARFALDAPELIGWLGFYLAWSTPWLLGAWWRSRYEAGGFDERRVGLAIVAGAIVVGALLVVFADYSPALIDAVPGARSNTTPPTVYTAVAAIGQVGLLLVMAKALDRVGTRFRKLLDRAGELALGIYAWHLTALALCGAAIAAGFPTPERLTTVWWLTRPLWWAAVLGLAAGFVLRRRWCASDCVAAAATASAARVSSGARRGPRRRRRRAGRTSRPAFGGAGGRVRRAVHRRLAATAPARRLATGA